jgi:hypothetical protein
VNALSRQRCANHIGREAVARCPSCARFYCRECVTEHEDRLLCASCIGKLTSLQTPARYTGFGKVVLLSFSVIAAWLFFYWMGELLLLLPTTFHEGTFWKTIASTGLAG